MEDEFLYYKILGNYFGYPTCCQKDFIKRSKLIDTGCYQGLSDNQKIAVKLLNDGGYIPCESHALEILKGKDINEILSHRYCKTLFPEEGDEYDCKKYIQDVYDFHNKHRPSISELIIIQDINTKMKSIGFIDSFKDASVIPEHHYYEKYYNDLFFSIRLAFSINRIYYAAIYVEEDDVISFHCENKNRNLDWIINLDKALDGK